jgi:putative spermidine/putrescine transport system ATP-binding protein
MTDTSARSAQGTQDVQNVNVSTGQTAVAAGRERTGSAASRAGGGAMVELLDLHRRFGATRALDGLSLTIQPGEFVAFLGPSGCGKTTALRVLAGFETADSGRVLVDGHDVAGVAAQKRDMGMVFQSYSLFPNMSALDNVGFGLRMRGVKGSERRRRAAALLEMVGLSTQARKYPHQLSGGQQQRVALARALAIEPRVLLLDEPLSALDAKVRVQLREQIRALQTRLQITTVFVTHDQEEALSMADRVCVMRNGRIEQVDVPAVLYANPATAFVAEFVGTMNRIPGRVSSSGVVVLGKEVGVRGDVRPLPGTDVNVLVRPEELTFNQDAGGRGIVMSKTFLGAVTRVAVLLDDGVAVYVDRSSTDAATVDPGAAVTVQVLAPEVMLAEPAAPDPAGSAGGSDAGPDDVASVVPGLGLGTSPPA